MYACEPSEVDPPAEIQSPMWSDVQKAIMLLYTILATLEITLQALQSDISMF